MFSCAYHLNKQPCSDNTNSGTSGRAFVVIVAAVEVVLGILAAVVVAAVEVVLGILAAVVVAAVEVVLGIPAAVVVAAVEVVLGILAAVVVAAVELVLGILVVPYSFSNLTKYPPMVYFCIRFRLRAQPPSGE